jgi:glutaredoxin
MEQYIVVFSMKGCPFCDMLKNSLNEQKIEFIDRDIVEHEDEYDMFVKSVGGNEFVPAFMIIETDGKKTISGLYAPERDFNKIEEGLQIIKEQYKKNIQ